MAILKAEGLVKVYPRDKKWWKFWDQKTVVDGVSFEVERGEVVGLLGPNGAGKTTSFRMVTGQVTPNGGKVTFAGQEVTSLPMYRRARLGMGYLPQDHSIFRKLSIEENILAVLELLPVHPRLGRRPTRKERYEMCDEVLTKFGLIEKRHRLSATLSGGERRRLEIARCLVCGPSLILLDEPFVGIDPPTVNDIKHIISDLRKQNIAILITDHQVREVLQVADRGYIIYEGKVIAAGTPAELARDKTAVEVYIQHTVDGLKFAQQATSTQPSSQPVAPSPSLGDVVLHARLHSLLELLRTPEYQRASAELLQHGQAAIPVLVEALGWRDLEMRRRAFEVLRRIWGGIRFDPSGTEAERHQQLTNLRAALARRAA
ncbi:MAG: LPS export ABC transporter ATP-binding protein [Planctomycetia bacterium]|nr:LPS export ABC transporter ATP-binding protein [Planctomycetia bacterium]